MADFVNLYISAATDLESERDLLGRSVTEIPVSLGWRIRQSPSHGEAPDLEAVANADIHLLVLGSDIRAPIGLEWVTARRAGRRPILFFKEKILRTLAGEDFLRYLREGEVWKPFRDSVGLSRQVQMLLADHILDRADHYSLSIEEFERLKSWRSEVEAAGKAEVEQAHGGAGESSIILTTERYMPSEGVLIKDPKKSRS